VSYPDGRPVAVGEKVLDAAIADAGQEWLEGIGGVYSWLADATIGTPHRGFAREIRKRWRRRVAAGDWPRFTAAAAGVVVRTSA
jgi:hypothetical protein